MRTFVLRDVPDTLWNDVRDRRKVYGQPLRDVLLELLRDYASGKIAAAPHERLGAAVRAAAVKTAASTPSTRAQPPSGSPVTAHPQRTGRTRAAR